MASLRSAFGKRKQRPVPASPELAQDGRLCAGARIARSRPSLPTLASPHADDVTNPPPPHGWPLKHGPAGKKAVRKDRHANESCSTAPA